LNNKYKFSIVLICLVLLSSMGSISVSSTSRDHVISEEINISNFQVRYTKNSNNVILSLPEANSLLLKPGLPVLPVITKTFTFPFGTKIKSIKCMPSQTGKAKLSNNIEIAPKPVIIGTLSKGKSKTIEVELKKKFSEYPSKWFEYSEGCGLYGLERKVFLNLRLYPIKALSNGSIEYAKKFIIKIEYQTPEKSSSKENYDLLIISPSQFSDELQPLVEHKNNFMNIKTKLVNLEDIPTGGRDQAEDLKYFIKDAIENLGIKFVLLVGSAEKLPTRYVYVNDDVETRFVSDLYYADIYDANKNYSSWDTNNNNIFAEFNYNGNFDEMDLYPDVYVGRLACVNEDEVTNVVNKIINYEKNRAYAQNWFGNIILCGGDTVPGDNEDVDEGEFVNQAVLETMNGFNGVKIWASNGKLYYTSNIDNALEEGAGFIDFSGHGNPTLWATHPHDKENTWIPTGGYRNSHVSTLPNSEKLPIAIISACSCSKFDEREDCLGWSFVSNGNGGAIATLGNTGLGWIYIGKYITYGLVGLMEINSFRAYSLDDSKYFGELWGNALRRYINEKGGSDEALDYKTIMEWQPLGDPTLAIASPSQKPHKPARPNGPSQIKAGKTYNYTTSTADPDGDQVYYWFDWGDGTNSGWLGPYNSGENVTASHKWEKRGEYAIKVRAKDIHGAMSEWSDPLPIKAPFSYLNSFFEKIYFIIARYLSR